MSKIQDALKRLQKSNRTTKNPEGAPGQVAQLSDTRQLKTLKDNHRKDLYLEVDRVLLRKAGLMPPEEQTRHIADQYRLIKRPILDLASGKLADAPQYANLLMVASALPGDGKTFNAINIALSIAVEKDKSVLLVDADVAKPHISRLFNLQDELGLIDVLRDPHISLGDVILQSDISNLSFLPAGRQDELATELLASRRMENVLKDLSGADPDRIVVFDSPPLLVTSESRVLAQKMGQIAMVICAGKTPTHAVESAIGSIHNDQPVNLILNQSSGALSDSGYGAYGYGYGERGTREEGM